MQKHERKKKRLRLSLEIRRRYSISHHVVAISPRWLNTNLTPKNCNPTAMGTLLFNQAKFCPTKSHMPVFYYLTPWSFHAILRPPSSILAYYRTNKKNTSPYHERMHGFIQSGIQKEKLEMLPSIPHFLPFEGMLPQVCSQALSPEVSGASKPDPKKPWLHLEPRKNSNLLGQANRIHWAHLTSTFFWSQQQSTHLTRIC